MASRKELKQQKEKTSQALIQAALDLCAQEGYASLSLRSVARKAGIAPTSFYRHFREIDEMGVEMVTQARAVLTDCLAQATKKMTFPPAAKKDSPAHLLKSIECMTRPFVETFMKYSKTHKQLFYLFFQERTGNSEAMRTAISEAADALTGLLAEDLARLGSQWEAQPDDIPLLCEAMLQTAGSSVMEKIVTPDADTRDVTVRAIRKLNLMFLGALVRSETKAGGGNE